MSAGRREQAIELVYRKFHDHGWADHWRCGWEDGPNGERTIQSDEGMCGKEWHERQSIGEILDDLRASRLLS